jgi:hypothetical protein
MANHFLCFNLKFHFFVHKIVMANETESLLTPSKHIYLPPDLSLSLSLSLCLYIGGERSSLDVPLSCSLRIYSSQKHSRYSRNYQSWASLYFHRVDIYLRPFRWPTNTWPTSFYKLQCSLHNFYILVSYIYTLLLPQILYSSKKLSRYSRNYQSWASLYFHLVDISGHFGSEHMVTFFLQVTVLAA